MDYLNYEDHIGNYVDKANSFSEAERLLLVLMEKGKKRIKPTPFSDIHRELGFSKRELNMCMKKLESKGYYFIHCPDGFLLVDGLTIREFVILYNRLSRKLNRAYGKIDSLKTALRKQTCGKLEDDNGNN